MPTDLPIIDVSDPRAQAIIHGPCRPLNRDTRPDESIVGEWVGVRCSNSAEEMVNSEAWEVSKDVEWEPFTSRHHPGCVIGVVRVVGAYEGPRPFNGEYMLPVDIDSRWHDQCYGHTAEEFRQSVEGDPWYSDSTDVSWLLDSPRPIDPVACEGDAIELSEEAL